MPIAAIANSHVFTANAHYVFGDLRTWGWITLPAWGGVSPFGAMIAAWLVLRLP